MDYLRRSARVSSKVNYYWKSSLLMSISRFLLEQSILDRIQRRQLKWYGHFLRMEDSRWPKKIYQWTPQSRRRGERAQQSWKNQVTDFTRSRNMEEEMEEDRHFGICQSVAEVLLTSVASLGAVSHRLKIKIK